MGLFCRGTPVTYGCVLLGADVFETLWNMAYIGMPVNHRVIKKMRAVLFDVGNVLFHWGAADHRGRTSQD